MLMHIFAFLYANPTLSLPLHDIAGVAFSNMLNINLNVQLTKKQQKQ